MLRKIIFGGLVLAGSFAGALWAMDKFWPTPKIPTERRPVLVEMPALPPVTRTSVVVAPTTIPLSAIREAMDAAAPRNLSGKPDNKFSDLLSKAEVGWTATRGPIAVSGRPQELTVTTPFNGTLRATGLIAAGAGNLTGTLGGIVNTDLGRGLQNLTEKVVDQRADIRGNVIMTARPVLTPGWRLEPNLSAQVVIPDGSVSLAGIKLNVSKEIKPLIDRPVAEQVAALQAQLRGNPFIEQTARREWAKMCRSIALGAAAPGMPNLWLEMRPTRAFTTQPRIDATAVIIAVGVQAETRIVPAETKPNCPFPANLEMVPQMDQGRIAIGVPIDVPFADVNRLVEAQLKGQTFSDANGTVDVTVQQLNVAPSQGRLLISMRVKAREKKSFFGFGAEADVHVWGRPTIDQKQQILRLTDIALDVESESAFGLLGRAARAAMPYLQQALAERAVIDLKPLAAAARKGIEAAIADFDKRADAVSVTAAITDLRLVEIEFDSKTLRVIAEANGNVRVAVSSLAMQ
jgi:hypothetical protein